MRDAECIRAARAARCLRGRQPAHARPAAGRSIISRKEDRMTDRSEEHRGRPALGAGGGSGARFTRRTWLVGAAAAAATATGPFVWTRRAGAAGKGGIPTIGRAHAGGNGKANFEPFWKAAGIEDGQVPASRGTL